MNNNNDLFDQNPLETRMKNSRTEPKTPTKVQQKKSKIRRRIEEITEHRELEKQLNSFD